MVSSILIGVDDSSGADVALRWAAALADAESTRGIEVTTTAVTCWSMPPFDLAGQADGRLLEVSATKALEEALQRLDDPDRFGRLVAPGAPAEVLLQTAERHDVDLIVVGTRGRGALAQLLLGSVSRSVAARSNRPVAIVPPSAVWSDGPTVVGHDGSDGAEAALRWAAVNGDGPVTVASAWQLPTEAIHHPDSIDPEAFAAEAQQRLEAALDSLAAELPEAGVTERFSVEVERDDPRLLLVDRAKGACRVVIGARGHRGVRGLLLGSTVDFVASHSEQAVIIVPPVDDPAAHG